MELSDKEKKYLDKVLGSEKGLDLEIALSVLNKKRTRTEQLSLNDISHALEDMSHDGTSEANTKTEQKAEKSTGLHRHAGRLEELRELEQFEKDVEKITTALRQIVDSQPGLLAQLLMPPAPRFYEVLSHKTQAGLNVEVQNRINNGWIPLGGASAAAFGMSPVGGNQYIQAVVKY